MHSMHYKSNNIKNSYSNNPEEIIDPFQFEQSTIHGARNRIDGEDFYSGHDQNSSPVPNQIVDHLAIGL